MLEVNTLSNLKTMLAIKDNGRDDILKLIIQNTKQALMFKLGVTNETDFPNELSYIELEVCVRRFNRLKNEGMSQYSQEGESITFNSNDFDDFQDDIDAWKKQHNNSVLTAFDPYRIRG